MKKWMADTSGSMFVYVLIILIFLFTFSGLVGEIYRVHSIQTHVEYELQRAVNVAVEDAMIDSWRQDKTNHLDTLGAQQKLIEYFDVWLGLTPAMRKYNDGILLYEIELEPVMVTEDPPRMQVRGKIIIPTLYPLLSTNVEVPFMISSRNGRID